MCSPARVGGRSSSEDGTVTLDRHARRLAAESERARTELGRSRAHARAGGVKEAQTDRLCIRLKPTRDGDATTAGSARRVGPYSILRQICESPVVCPCEDGVGKHTERRTAFTSRAHARTLVQIGVQSKDQ